MDSYCFQNIYNFLIDGNRLAYAEIKVSTASCYFSRDKSANSDKVLRIACSDDKEKYIYVTFDIDSRTAF